MAAERFVEAGKELEEATRNIFENGFQITLTSFLAINVQTLQKLSWHFKFAHFLLGIFVSNQWSILFCSKLNL